MPNPDSPADITCWLPGHLLYSPHQDQKPNRSSESDALLALAHSVKVLVGPPKASFCHRFHKIPTELTRIIIKHGKAGISIDAQTKRIQKVFHPIVRRRNLANIDRVFCNSRIPVAGIARGIGFIEDTSAGEFLPEEP